VFSLSITPRFSETDALGHINNTVVPVWFESAREPIFKIFNPDLDLSKWNLIVAKIDVSFIAQMDYQAETEIRTYVEKLGNSSLKLKQQVVQNGQIAAEGFCTLVKFNYDVQKSEPIDDTERKKLLEHQFHA
jgi:acyl-CoA thioester hydrolase